MMCLPMCISSCIPDDTPDNGNAIVCINTASLCEKLGIADLVAGMLAEKASFKITDSVLVYDRQGQLVARQGAESSSLQTVTIHLSDIPQGTYTLVAWQTTTTGTEPFWLLMEAEQLATAHIVQLYPSTISSFRAIGLYTTTVTIGTIVPVFNEEIFQEYEDVLHRAKFNLPADAVDSILDAIAELGVTMGRTPTTEDFPDPKDIVFYEVALSKEDSYLVTGNTKHFPKNPIVVTPAELLTIIKQQNSSSPEDI